MSYKKAPSIKQQNKKSQILAEKRAFNEHVDRMYLGHPQIEEAIQQFVKQEINKNNDR